MKLYCSDKRYISVSLLKVPPVKGSMDLKHVIYEFYYKRAIRGEGADLPCFFFENRQKCPDCVLFGVSTRKFPNVSLEALFSCAFNEMFIKDD